VCSSDLGMAFVMADYDGDGRMDVFVPNDNMANSLFHNRGNGTFEETAVPSGVAFRDDGSTISNMGADFRDVDNDGLPDLFVSALAGQTFPLFRNLGKGAFRDITYTSRMAALSRSSSGWGLGVVDLNNDGWKDIFVACSHVNDVIEQFEANRYRLNNVVFRNSGNGAFEDDSGPAGLNRPEPKAHRGAAFAHFNHDGKIDVAVSALNQPAELWENISPGPANWIAIKLQGVRSNRDGIGARVRVDSQYNHMTTSFGYASSSYDGVHFGLGANTAAHEIEVVWPSGTIQLLKDVPANQVVVIREPSAR
jgi:enediyne biosynthesis protein E4